MVRYLAPVRGAATAGSYDATGLGLSGSQHARHVFAADGEYRFTVMLDGTQPRGPEPLRTGVWIDGTLLGSAGTATGIVTGRTIEVRGPVTAGEHTVSASFLK